MADLLIRIRDKESSGDAFTDELQFKRGDVIDVKESPGIWGEELRNPDWRILRLTNVSAADVIELLREERAADQTLMRKRKARLNIDSAALPLAVRTWLQDDTRQSPILTVGLSRAAVLALVENKVPRFRLRVL